MEKIDKRLLSILIISAVIVGVASFEIFVSLKIESSNTDDDISCLLFVYFANIFLPVLISLYVFFTAKKLGFGFIFRLVFGGMILMKLINIILKFEFYSGFYYTFIILYALFFAITVFSCPMKRK